MSLFEHTLRTRSNKLHEITKDVHEAVKKSGVKSGICIIYCPHTTAGITINENADPDVAVDFGIGISRMAPDLPEFRHMEGNSAAHIKSSLMGGSETIIIENGGLLLGTWQGIYFAEFDGPRSRRFYVKVIEG